MTFSGTRPTNKTTNRAICLSCHDGLAPASSSVTVRNVTPLSRPSTVAEHQLSDTTPCKNCHDPHNPPAGGPDCLTCHTAGGSAGSTYDYIDALFKGVGSDNAATKPSPEPANGYEWSQHGGFDGSDRPRFVYRSPWDKPNNDCQKCHGERHKNADRLIHPDPNDTGADAFDPAGVVSLQATAVANANNFCLACHDGDGADRQLGDPGVDPPVVDRTNWTGIGHGKESGSYASGNSAANLRCVACHEVHASNHAKLLAADNNTTPGLDLRMPSQFAEKTVGSTQARDLDFRDYTDPARAGAGFDNNWKSSKGFGTTGDPAGQYGVGSGEPSKITTGLCDACHRDDPSVNQTLNKAHTHMGIAGQGDPVSQMSFVRDCAECHNPHGAAAANIYMIADNIVFRPGTASEAVRTVNFTALSGTGEQRGGPVHGVSRDE
jgi:predicted CXXCH cytochrome family protein